MPAAARLAEQEQTTAGRGAGGIGGPATPTSNKERMVGSTSGTTYKTGVVVVVQYGAPRK